jgi:hypothetical protein
VAAVVDYQGIVKMVPMVVLAAAVVVGIKAVPLVLAEQEFLDKVIMVEMALMEMVLGQEHQIQAELAAELVQSDQLGLQTHQQVE